MDLRTSQLFLLVMTALILPLGFWYDQWLVVPFMKGLFIWYEKGNLMTGGALLMLAQLCFALAILLMLPLFYARFTRVWPPKIRDSVAAVSLFTLLIIFASMTVYLPASGEWQSFFHLYG